MADSVEKINLMRERLYFRNVTFTTENNRNVCLATDTDCASVLEKVPVADCLHTSRTLQVQRDFKDPLIYEETMIREQFRQN